MCCRRLCSPRGRLRAALLHKVGRAAKLRGSERWAFPSPHSSHYSKSPSILLPPPLFSPTSASIHWPGKYLGGSKPPRTPLAFASPANSRNIEPITRLLSGGGGRGALWECSNACQGSLLDEEKWIKGMWGEGGWTRSCPLACTSLQLPPIYRHSRRSFFSKKSGITPGKRPFSADHLLVFTPPYFTCQVVIFLHSQ